MGPSIEGTFKIAIRKATDERVSLQAASRTDAGVHARMQVINFSLTKRRSLAQLREAIAENLPDTISLIKVDYANEQFHPTLDCNLKEYRYYLCLGTVQSPQYRRYSWHIHKKLDIEMMQYAANTLVGQHDFSSFCNVKKNDPYENTICTIEKISIEAKSGNRLIISIHGQRFLYKMVRNIVGTLVDIGKGKISASEIKTILESKDRTKAGVSAPAHGLFLHSLYY